MTVGIPPGNSGQTAEGSVFYHAFDGPVLTTTNLGLLQPLPNYCFPAPLRRAGGRDQAVPVRVRLDDRHQRGRGGPFVQRPHVGRDGAEVDDGSARRSRGKLGALPALNTHAASLPVPDSTPSRVT